MNNKEKLQALFGVKNDGDLLELLKDNGCLARAYNEISSGTTMRYEFVGMEDRGELNIYTVLWIDDSTNTKQYQVLIDYDTFVDELDSIDDFIDKVADYDKEAQSVKLIYR